MKKKIFNSKKIIGIITLFALLLPSAAFATAPDEIDPLGAIDNLTTLIASIISAIGAGFLLYGILQMAIAQKRQDSASKAEALNSVVGGIIAIAAPWIVAYIVG